MMNAIRRFCSQAIIDGKATTGAFDLVEFVSYKAGYALLSLCFYCVVAAFAYGQVDLTRWVVGNAFTLCTAECVFNLGATFTRERNYGRLKTIFAAPTNKLAVVLASGVFPIGIAFLTIALGFVAGGLIFGVSFSNLNIPLFALSILAATFATAGLGLFVSVFALLSDSIHLILNTVALLVMIFSGANFAVSQLPGIFQGVAFVFPLNRSIRAANLCFSPSIGGEFWGLLLGEVLLGLCFFVAAFALLKSIERLAVRWATLDRF
ncbi:MAG: ABC transporter permease [Oscillospiraceae bacterium]|jgi:ABC-2 type transport system permease protein|nr:ABC transporter permease [Oscillospiraceae bacterium]